MEPRRPKVPEYTLEVFADPTCVKDIVKGTNICAPTKTRVRNKVTDSLAAILHTIFFHRYFIPIIPLTRELLDQTLPAIDDVDLETLIDQRAASLVRAIETPSVALGGNGRPQSYSSNNGQSGRAQIAVQFFEKKRKKTYFFGKGDEEVCWELWTLDVTCATPRTESGKQAVILG